ncbi:MAG: hypothetical protein A4E65_03600 [Syntrophorhabdus sp. PtaU1.Bin153]|nr:MAG: hypothetical protein A4E65_03600 [Syntrophorhabdus sp. PtaU1.Bin153]
MAGSVPPANFKTTLAKCRDFWVRSAEEEMDPRARMLRNEKIRRDLRGRLMIAKPDRPFCFISSESEDSYFCLKSELPQGATDRDEVVFDAVPSFDRKKNRQSWKAVNVRTT